MKVGLAAVGPLLLLAIACVTRERVIVVKEPTPGGPTETVPIEGNPVIADPGNDSPIASDEPDWGIKNPSDSREYARVTDRVANMVSDSDLVRRVQRRSLALVNVMWEDTGRAQGSSLGPNISDLTLQVRQRDESGRFQSAIMPVIRPPNFADRTGDVPADRFFIRVGNEQGNNLRSIPLTDVLRNLKSFASQPETIVGGGNLLASRDTHFLVSAQAVFLPIPKSGKAQFNPVLFNYQSAPGSPAVLSILVTRQGTSIQVVENNPKMRRRRAGGRSSISTTRGSAPRSPPSAKATSNSGSMPRAGRETRTTRVLFKREPTSCSSCRCLSSIATSGASATHSRPRRWRPEHPPRPRRPRRWPRPPKQRRRRATSSKRCSDTVRTSDPSTRATA